MKRIFPSLIAILCTLPMSVKAQMPRITSYDGGLNAFRKIRKEKEVYDTAKIAVYYDLKYLKDSTKTDKYTEAKTLLQISDKYTKYGDYYQLALDSMDIYMGKSKKNARDTITQLAFLTLPIIRPKCSFMTIYITLNTPSRHRSPGILQRETQ